MTNFEKIGNLNWPCLNVRYMFCLTNVVSTLMKLG